MNKASLEQYIKEKEENLSSFERIRSNNFYVLIQMFVIPFFIIVILFSITLQLDNSQPLFVILMILEFIFFIYLMIKGNRDFALHSPVRRIFFTKRIAFLLSAFPEDTIFSLTDIKKKTISISTKLDDSKIDISYWINLLINNRVIPTGWTPIPTTIKELNNNTFYWLIRWKTSLPDMTIMFKGNKQWEVSIDIKNKTNMWYNSEKLQNAIRSTFKDSKLRWEVRTLDWQFYINLYDNIWSAKFNWEFKIAWQLSHIVNADKLIKIISK